MLIDVGSAHPLSRRPVRYAETEIPTCTKCVHIIAWVGRIRPYSDASFYRHIQTDHTCTCFVTASRCCSWGGERVSDADECWSTLPDPGFLWWSFCGKMFFSECVKWFSPLLTGGQKSTHRGRRQLRLKNAAEPAGHTPFRVNKSIGDASPIRTGVHVRHSPGRSARERVRSVSSLKLAAFPGAV